jgi:hypothetical protein
MRAITVRGWLLILAFASFLLSALFLLMVLSYSCCGVTYFSPQVSWSTRLQFLILPAIPGALGCLILVAWKTTKSEDR